MEYFFCGFGILIFGGLVSLVLPERFKSICTAIAAVASCCFIIIPASDVILHGQSITAAIMLKQPIGEVAIVIDRLSAFFVILISLMSSVSAIYAIGYMKYYIGQKKTLGSHFFFLSLLIASMLAVVSVQNAIAFLISWEIMSLSSFFLVVFENEKEEVFKAGMNYLIAMHIGVLFLISAFIILITTSGSLNFTAFSQVFAARRDLVNILFILFFVGFGTKAGFIPFHTWLPVAHPAAPSHVSGLMSGVMIKTGIYGILRILMMIGHPEPGISYFILFISLISGIIAIAYAAGERNLKKLLAYSSVENIGIIGIGIGVGMLGICYEMPILALLGFAGALLHVLNHSIFKSILFYAAGAVYHATHVLNLENLGGLIKTLKWTAVFFMIGSVAIAGLPPLNGFIGEFYIYWAMLDGFKTGPMPLSAALIFSFAGLAFIGSMALLCFTKAFTIAFLGAPRKEYHHTPSEISQPGRIAMLILCIFIVIIVASPVYVFGVMSNISSAITGIQGGDMAMPAVAALKGLYSGLLVFIGISVLVFIFRTLLVCKKTAFYKTWDCGYQAGNVRMQYTASSYTGTFLNLVRPVLHLKERLGAPSGLFPKEADYKSDIEDRFEVFIIKPVVKTIDRFLDLFKWIQSGNIQAYIFYGLVFLIVISLWMAGV